MAAPAAELEGADVVLSCAVGVRRCVCVCMKSEWEELCIYSVLHAGDASTSLTERALELTAWVHPPPAKPVQL